MNEARFELKNGKLYVLAAVFTIFFIIGGWVLLHSDSPALNINPIVVKISSIASLLFFAAIVYLCIKTALSKRMGLIINKNGITDKSSPLSFGFISKKSIKEARVEKLEGESYLMIELVDREKYLNSENDYIARLLRENIKNYGCEVMIPLSNLKCSFQEAKEAVNTIFNKEL
ncbi:MAG: hypothetical protein LBI78_03405 [Campylobacteraceae bacterium]|jgi:hypothetical protein|nr:hypothetical protein [Campylobacteraceae bacterium]